MSSCSPHIRRSLRGVDRIVVYSLPLVTRFRGVTIREGLLLHGEYGWGEAAPFVEYGPQESSRWLFSAWQAACVAPPQVHADRVLVNVTIPVSSPEEAVQRVEKSGGCATAKVKVADPRTRLHDDCERVEAVADALVRTVGQECARVRVDVNGVWDKDEAIRALAELDRAASSVGGLEYAEQPCATVEELAYVRKAQHVPIAADESIRRADDPMKVIRKQAADVAVVKVAPLGGYERTVDLAERTGVRVVVSSALESSVGLATGIRTAAYLMDQQEPVACGLATSQLLAADVTYQPLQVAEGFLPVTPIEPYEEAIGKKLLPDGTYDRWVSRLGDMCAYMEAFS
nr:o-succinylbenzoate synthase [Schaalia sp. lx-100]